MIFLLLYMELLCKYVENTMTFSLKNVSTGNPAHNLIFKKDEMLLLISVLSISSCDKYIFI